MAERDATQTPPTTISHLRMRTAPACLVLLVALALCTKASHLEFALGSTPLTADQGWVADVQFENEFGTNPTVGTFIKTMVLGLDDIGRLRLRGGAGGACWPRAGSGKHFFGRIFLRVGKIFYCHACASRPVNRRKSR